MTLQLGILLFVDVLAVSVVIWLSIRCRRLNERLIRKESECFWAHNRGDTAECCRVKAEELKDYHQKRAELAIKFLPPGITLNTEVLDQEFKEKQLERRLRKIERKLSEVKDDKRY